MQFRYDWFMDIQQLKYFLDVAQTEHMTRSAKRLNIAQPALSRSVSRLEHELGVSIVRVAACSSLMRVGCSNVN